MNDGRRQLDMRGWMTDWLSEARLRPYLRAAGGSCEKALRLYELNLDASLLLMRDISHFEIALRNAYDRALSCGSSAGRDWLFADASPVRQPLWRRARSGSRFDANELNRSKIDGAIDELHGNANADDVIAKLSFGFWSHMTDKAHERVLWIPYLHKVWPSGTNRSDLDRSIRVVNMTRNRIAHHEPLLLGAGAYDDVVRVSRMVVLRFCQLVPGSTLYGEGSLPIERLLGL